MMFAGLKASYIGKMEFNNVQKMVVVKNNPESRLHLYNFFACDLYSKEQPFHKEIVEMFKLDPKAVIGGCHVKKGNNEVTIFGDSAQYGGIPKRFFKFFEMSLLNEYQQDFPEIEKILIDVPETTSNDHKLTFLDAFVKT